MKSLFSAILLGGLLLSGFVYGQKGKKPAGDPAADAPAQNNPTEKTAAHYRAVYEQALNFNDLSVATDAAYHLLALGPDYAHYRDTLSVLYFQRGAWPQVVGVTSDILAQKPNEAGPLELRAVAYQTLGMIKESLADYETLYGVTKSPYHLYEIAALQYAMRRFGECDLTLGKLMREPGVEGKNIQLSAGQSTQSVPMLAACHNMVGVLLLDQGKKPEAQKAFEEALRLFPDFVLAKNNLAELNKQ